ncbi:MAG: mucin7-like protein [Candidatus Saccharibacteria bacterium]|nr:mucin7-like protein [Candidatus Saccharibacteria bacterium]
MLKRSFTVIAVLMLVGATPAPVMAQNETTQNAEGTASTSESSPENGPTGSDSVTYHYNQSTGLWENDYYTFDPSTRETTPKVPVEYTYNPATGLWDTTIWMYVASHSAYEQTPVAVSTPPAGAITHGGPAATDNNDTPAISPEDVMGETSPKSDTNTDQISSPPQPSDGSSGTDGLSGANHQENQNNRNNSNVDTTTKVGMDNQLLSVAKSGNTQAISNDDVGGVSTGNADAMANIVNMLQSQASFTGTGLATFTQNIQGNVSGDLLIDPATLMQPAAANTANLANATVNNQTHGTIRNDINLTATSGNATAEDNDDVLSVSTGNANAVADVVNMINSVVAANQSFLGVINIYGDYTGNILMPADSLNALLATADAANTSAHTTSNTTNNLNANVSNNVDLAAASGSATAYNNDDVGSVTTGDGLTNLTILNLTGRQVVAANSLLVFVNVLGTWVGLIMDAPAGTTSAALGGGVSSNAALANSSTSTNNENYGITNNITARATSGNAAATNNDDVGSVATGNATASANIANLINSNFSLSNWFGVLFINVFGAWHGNFGVVKPPVVAPITSGAAIPGQGGGVEQAFKNAKVFAFVPTSAGSGGSNRSHSSHKEKLTLTPVGSTSSSTTGGGSGSSDVVRQAGAVIGSSRNNALKPNTSVNKQATDGSMSMLSIALMTVGSAGLGLVAVERIRSSIRTRYQR